MIICGGMLDRYCLFSYLFYVCFKYYFLCFLWDIFFPKILVVCLVGSGRSRPSFTPSKFYGNIMFESNIWLLVVCPNIFDEIKLKILFDQQFFLYRMREFDTDPICYLRVSMCSNQIGRRTSWWTETDFEKKRRIFW